MSIFSCEGYKRGELLFIRHIVDAVRKGNFFLVDFYLGNIFSNCLVSQQHELLYQLMRLFALLYNDTNWFTFFIQLKPHFCGGEVNCAFLETLCPEALCKLIKQQYFIFKLTLCTFNYFLNIFIGIPVVAMNNGLAKPEAFDIAFLIYLEHCRKSKLVLLWTQRT